MKLHPSLPDAAWYFGLPAAAAGLIFIVCTVAGASSLQLGTTAARAVTGLLMVLPILLTLFLLQKENCPAMTLFLLLLPVALSLYLRLLFLDHQTHDYQTFLAQWAAFFRDNGGFAALKEPVGNYNVPYLYFLAAISYLPVPDLYLIKICSILCDVLLAWGGLRLTRQFTRENSPAPLICFGLLLLLPTVLLNGACWAQCDSLYTALILLAFSSALEDRPKTSVLLLALAFSFKLQTVFVIPLWCVFWFTGRVKFRHLLLFPVGYAATILPALALGKPLGDILGIYVGQMGEHEAYLTLNAPSVYAFLPYQAQVDTALLSTLGILAAFALVFVVLGALFFLRRRVTGEILLAAATVLALGVPFLLPHMHERYFFPAGMLAVVWACADTRRVPIAALTELASLSCYSTYLRLQYTLPLLIGGRYYIMAFEAALILAALIWSIVGLIRLLSAKNGFRNNL